MSVSGLNTGATVKYQGVNIGKVQNIKVNPEDLSSILVFVLIEKGFPVKKDMSATLAYTGITGLKFIELSGGETKSENLEPRGEISTKRGLGEKAEDIVKGPAEDFCLIVVQRRHLDDTQLVVKGATARQWMTIAQTYAGLPGAGRKPGMFSKSTP